MGRVLARMAASWRTFLGGRASSVNGLPSARAVAHGFVRAARRASRRFQSVVATGKLESAAVVAGRVLARGAASWRTLLGVRASSTKGLPSARAVAYGCGRATCQASRRSQSVVATGELESAAAVVHGSRRSRRRRVWVAHAATRGSRPPACVLVVVQSSKPRKFFCGMRWLCNAGARCACALNLPMQ